MMLRGPRGKRGSAGAGGSAGINGYATLGGFVQPAVLATVSNVSYAGPGPGVGSYLDLIVSASVAGRYLVTADTGSRVNLQLVSEGTVTAGNAVATSLALHSGPAGAAGATGATGGVSIFDPVVFCQGAGNARIPTLLTETTAGAAQSYGIGIVATIPGLTCTGFTFRAAIASGSHTFNCNLYEFDGGAVKRTATQAHSAGTSNHTVSWAAYTMDVGSIYWLMLFCTTANKRNSLSYSGSGCRGPDVPTSQVPSIYVAQNVLLKALRYINTEAAPIDGSGSDFGSGTMIPITPTIVQP